MLLVARALVVSTLCIVAATLLLAQSLSFAVTVVPPAHGTLHLTPPLPADGRYPAGTVVTLTTPDAGYVLDSAWYSVPGRFGQMYHEGMASQFKVTIDQDKRVGASFVEASRVKDIVVRHDITYAKPGVKPLSHIPNATERSVPQFLTRGTRDRLITDGAVKEFVDALVTAGQRVEYVQVGGAGHAFFDWKPDENTKATFARFGVYYAAAIRNFFLSTLY